MPRALRRKQPNAKWWKIELGEALVLALALLGIIAVLCVFFIRVTPSSIISNTPSA